MRKGSFKPFEQQVANEEYPMLLAEAKQLAKEQGLKIQGSEQDELSYIYFDEGTGSFYVSTVRWNGRSDVVCDDLLNDAAMTTQVYKVVTFVD